MLRYVTELEESFALTNKSACGSAQLPRECNARAVAGAETTHRPRPTMHRSSQSNCSGDQSNVPACQEPAELADGEPPSPAREPAAERQRPNQARVPFVWQHGRRLLLLDEEFSHWVMAEFRFDTERCRYVEIRRATYHWAREAIGVVLSRAFASGGEAAEDAARSLNAWLLNRSSDAPQASPSASPDSSPSSPVA